MPSSGLSIYLKSSERFTSRFPNREILKCFTFTQRVTAASSLAMRFLFPNACDWRGQFIGRFVRHIRLLLHANCETEENVPYEDREPSLCVRYILSYLSKAHDSGLVSNNIDKLMNKMQTMIYKFMEVHLWYLLMLL